MVIAYVVQSPAHRTVVHFELHWTTFLGIAISASLRSIQLLFNYYTKQKYPPLSGPHWI